MIPKSSHRKGRNPNRDSGYAGDEWLSPGSAGEQKSTNQHRQKPPRSPRSSLVASQQPTASQVRQQDWDDLKKSPEVQRRKKGTHFYDSKIYPRADRLKLLMNFRRALFLI